MRPAAAIVAILLSACATPALSESAHPGGTPEAAASDLCQDIDLRSPSGEPVDLGGEWTTAPSDLGFFQTFGETTWILQIDDCVWGAIMNGAFLDDPGGRDGNLGTLVGHLTQKFTIEGDLITVEGGVGAPGPHASISLRIEWDNGQIRLREDRDPSVVGPRCAPATGGPLCTNPVILYRVDDLPSPLLP